MNRDHLGDAYDYWKRAMLDVLRGGGRTLKIIPMFTDDPKWSEQEVSTYEFLLGASTHEVVSPVKFHRKKGSRSYFDHAKKWRKYDLFLDPDTGIASNKSRHSSKKNRISTKHLKNSELKKLLNETNLVAVYQHAPRTGKGWLAEKLKDLRRNHIKAVGYEAGQVGMIFATKSAKRSSDVLKRLRNIAGPTAEPVSCRITAG